MRSPSHAPERFPFAVNCSAPGGAEPFELGDHLTAERVEIDRHARDRDGGAEPRARQVEQVRDHPAHAVGAVQHPRGDADAPVAEILRADQHRRAHDDRRERVPQVVAQDADRLVAEALGRLREAADGLRERFVDRLVEAGHAARIVPLLLPEPQDAGAQGAVLRDHLAELEAALDAQRGMDLPDFFEAPGPAPALGLLRLLGGRLPGLHVADDRGEDVVGVVAQRNGFQPRGRWLERAGEHFPLRHDGGALLVDEVGQFGASHALSRDAANAGTTNKFQ